MLKTLLDFLDNSFKKSVSLQPKIISNYDLVVITTDHDNIDYKLIYDNAPLILDTRGKYLNNEKKLLNVE